MADDKQDAAPATEEAVELDAAADGGGKGKKKIALVVLLYVGVVFAAAALTELFIVPQVSRMLAAKGLVPPQEPEAEPEPQAFNEIHVIEDLIVNPAGSGGTRYLAASVGLQPREAAMLAEMEKRDPQIKDALLRILGSHTVPDLADVERREQIRLEIKRKVEELLAPHKLEAVYFVSFVLQ